MALFGRRSSQHDAPEPDNGGTWVDCECLKETSEGTCPCVRKWQIPAGRPVPRQPICDKCCRGDHTG